MIFIYVNGCVYVKASVEYCFAFKVFYRHQFSWPRHHGNKDEAEAEDRVCTLLHGLPAGPRLCPDAAR